MIFHITTVEAWRKALQDGVYTAPSLQSEGFIHCSTESQTAGVLERYFAGQKDLVQLVIDEDKLNSELQYDFVAEQDEDYPHVYGPINIDAVMDAIML
jgi:uncharacterized protein (DUF952 family)